MADPVVGSILGGKYLVEGILGQGGMGVVVAARHIELDQKVAIKCLLAHAQAVPEIVERFTREARAAAKIHGEHVARVIDVGRFEDGTPFMVMEHLKGRDLADELASKGALPVVDAVRYILETCEALVQAHALRIVHRDLKPANLFLAEQAGHRAIVKVLDFGISKVIDPSGGALTKTASIMGTPYYMSPEQLLSSKSVDERSDIWALGIILYELLIGRPPFVAETAPEIVAQVLQNQPEPITSFRQDVPQGILDAVARCMKSKVNERFANVADLAQALVPFAAPEDRGSALAIARVLGVEAGPASVASAHVAMHAPTISASMPGGAPATAGTAHNLALSASQTETAARKPFGAIAAAAGGVAALAAIAITGVVVLRRPPSSGAAAVGTPSIENVAAAAASAAPPLPAAVGLAPVEKIAPAPAAASAAEPAAAVPTPSAPAHAAAVKHVAPAAAAAAAVAPAHPAAAPAAPPAAAAPAPASNPLDMHIK
jgi:serine/threonine-protein kinase